MMDVFYYYIYLFYVKVMSDNQPHSRTVWALGFLFSLIINCPLDMGLAYFFSYTLSIFQLISMSFLFLGPDIVREILEMNKATTLPM